MPMQTGTYIETAGHVYKNKITTAQLPLDRTILLPSFSLQIPSAAHTQLLKKWLLKRLKELVAHLLSGAELLFPLAGSSAGLTQNFYQMVPSSLPM